MTTTSKPRKRHDWDAIHRDYRTGQFTLKELEAKHGAGYADISRRSKKESWAKDLRAVVRQATSAAVIAEATKQLQIKSQGAAADSAAGAVLAVAEMNKQVIIGHRLDLNRGRAVASELLEELETQRLQADERELLAQILAGEAGTQAVVAQARQVVAKALALGGRVTAFKAWADAVTKLHAGERAAFGLDASEGEGVRSSVADAIAAFVGGIHGASSGRLTFASPNRVT